MKSNLVYTLFISMLLASCEGMMDIRGTIQSSDKYTPIDSVMVEYREKINRFNTRLDTVYTDKNGYFRVGGLTMSFPNSPEVKIIFTKKGYNPHVKSYEAGIIHDSITIVLTKKATN